MKYVGKGSKLHVIDVCKQSGASHSRSQISSIRKWRHFIAKIRTRHHCPATIAGLMPKEVPMPIMAMPTVAEVDHDDPVNKDTIEQIIRAMGRKITGLSNCMPTYIMVGMMPLKIQVEESAPTINKIKMASVVSLRLRPIFQSFFVFHMVVKPQWPLPLHLSAVKLI